MTTPRCSAPQGVEVVGNCHSSAVGKAWGVTESDPVSPRTYPSNMDDSQSTPDADRWLQVRYPEIGVESLRALEEHLAKVVTSPGETWRWRWILITAHDALQCFLVAATKGSDQLGASTDRYQDKWRDNYGKGALDTPGDRLTTASDLLVRAGELRGFVDSKALALDSEDERRLNKLMSWRRELAHPKAVDRLVEIDGMPDLVRAALSTIDFLAVESMHVYRIATEAESYIVVRDRLRLTLAQLPESASGG